MHFEILVEDQSGQKMLDILVPKIIGADHTCKVIAYKGVGRIPKNINAGVDASRRMLLNNLPRLLKGYGKSWTNYPAALKITPHMDVANNASPSFVYLRKKLLALAASVG